MRVHNSLGLVAEHFVPLQDIAGRIGTRRGWAQAQGETPLERLRLFIVTRAIRGAVDSAMLEQPGLLDSREFEDELVKLAVLYAANPTQARERDRG
jgi:hypothetical protein